MFRKLLLTAVSLAATTICSASSLYFTGTGTFSAGDTPDAFVIPGDTFSFSFVVPSNPVTNANNSTSLSFDVTPILFTYRLNGSPVSVGQPSEITFYTTGDGGGFALNVPPSSSGTEFIFSDPANTAYFSGTTANPVFSPAKFLSESFLFLDPNNGDIGSATAALTPTPEPSSILLLFCGGVGLLTVGIHKSVRAR